MNLWKDTCYIVLLDPSAVEEVGILDGYEPESEEEHVIGIASTLTDAIRRAVESTGIPPLAIGAPGIRVVAATYDPLDSELLQIVTGALDDVERARLYVQTQHEVQDAAARPVNDETEPPA